MSLRLDRATDRYVGHDYPGVMGGGFTQFELDEIELGGRVAQAIDDPEQSWWEIHCERIERDQQGR